MLIVSQIIENFESICNSLDKRNFNAKHLLGDVIKFDKDRRATQTKLDELLSEINTLSSKIGSLYKKNEIDKANILKEKVYTLKNETKSFSKKLIESKEKINTALLDIPNIPHELVKKGYSEDDNEIIFDSQNLPKYDKSHLTHWDLSKKLNIIDFDLGSKVTGSGFPVYLNKGAKLQRALINYFLDKNIDAGYEEVQVPILINEKSGIATGQLPDKEGQMYYINDDNLYLAPTAEVPVTNMFRDSIIDSKSIPLCLTSYTPCFRREAGSYGSQVRGLNRLHQFDKVEIVRIENPKNSYKALDSMVDHVKSILSELELPFRIVRLCGGDLGFTSALTYDFEVYSSAQKKWLEVSSVSNFETFQSNRLKLRINENGKKFLAHTLNGSALALPRVLACIIENFQERDSILIPKALRSYTGFDKISL